MKPQKKYSGVVIPAVTPLQVNFSLDKEAVEKMFDHFRSHGAFPFILGTTGEAASLPFSLKKEFLQTAGGLKKTGDVLYAGISSNVFVESVALAKHAFENGADVVVATLPSYYALSESSMVKYFEQLANDIEGPLMIYNIPATTHMSVPLNIIDELSHLQNIVGVKDSERNEERLTQSLELWRERKDFSYLLGWAAKSAHAMLNGADGLVPSTGNFAPRLYTQLFESGINGESEKAFQFQQSSDLLGELYQKGRTLGESLWALKVVMNEMDLCGTTVMPPLYAMTVDEEKKIKENFQAKNTNQPVS